MRASSDLHVFVSRDKPCNDVCLLENLSNTFAVNPKDPKVESAATGVAYELNEILSRWN